MVQEEALLGLATTRELMEELKARSEIGGFPGTHEADVASDMDIFLEHCSDEFLNYRTVDSEQLDRRPHSRACGILAHPHGQHCSTDCPTCQLIRDQA